MFKDKLPDKCKLSKNNDVIVEISFKLLDKSSAITLLDCNGSLEFIQVPDPPPVIHEVSQVCRYTSQNIVIKLFCGSIVEGPSCRQRCYYDLLTRYSQHCHSLIFFIWPYMYFAIREETKRVCGK